MQERLWLSEGWLRLTLKLVEGVADGLWEPERVKVVVWRGVRLNVAEADLVGEADNRLPVRDRDCDGERVREGDTFLVAVVLGLWLVLSDRLGVGVRGTDTETVSLQLPEREPVHVGLSVSEGEAVPERVRDSDTDRDGADRDAEGVIEALRLGVDVTRGVGLTVWDGEAEVVQEALADLVGPLADMVQVPVQEAVDDRLGEAVGLCDQVPVAEGL